MLRLVIATSSFFSPFACLSVIHTERLAHLVQAGAHQFALEVVQHASKSVDRGPSSLVRAVEQAVRLLEIVASVGAFTVRR